MPKLQNIPAMASPRGVGGDIKSLLLLFFRKEESSLTL
jgi:hypothetical protein